MQDSGTTQQEHRKRRFFRQGGLGAEGTLVALPLIFLYET
jgi:hypothetical protein